MTPLQSIVLGIVQGLTEFLPISSSAHLILVPWLFKWTPHELAFDVALHWGTLLGVCLYFRKDLIQLLNDFFISVKTRDIKTNPLPWYLIVATVPAAVLGFLFDDVIEHHLRSPWVVSITLFALALLLLVADRIGQKKWTLPQLTWSHAFILGVAQSLALIPGVSRSGVTMTVALFLGLTRPASVQFSFLMAIPIIFGAGLLKLPDMVPLLTTAPLWIGIGTSALSGMAAIHFLLNYVKSKSFTPFVVYRVVLALFIAAWILKQ